MGAEWTRALPEAAGFVPDIGRRLDAGVESGLLGGLHAVAVSRGGKLVLESYFSGEDEHMGDPIGHVAFGPDTQHDLRSVTKSTVGVLYGMALERGLVPPVQASLFAQFPRYGDLAADPARARITIEHALSMTMGLEWDESRPYTDPLNSEIAMELAADRYRYALDRPIVAEPGGSWIYSGGAVALIGGLIERGTGKTLPEFAREVLFEPLAITEFTWWAGADGIHSPAAGLRLRLRDLLRIGAMLSAGGRHEGRQIVPAAWLEASFTPRSTLPNGERYGYLWRLREGARTGAGGSHKWIAGMGNGGQRLWLMPDLDLVCATYAGNYNGREEWVTPNRVWFELVLGNLVGA